MKNIIKILMIILLIILVVIVTVFLINNLKTNDLEQLVEIFPTEKSNIIILEKSNKEFNAKFYISDECAKNFFEKNNDNVITKDQVVIIDELTQWGLNIDNCDKIIYLTKPNPSYNSFFGGNKSINIVYFFVEERDGFLVYCGLF